MRRVGVFGGTFNPIHNGHIRLAHAFIDALALDQLLVIPAHTPPHKQGSGLVSGEHRLRMCELAFADVPICAVSDIELVRGEKSYTVDTLEALHAGECQDAQLYLIMGSDMFFTMTSWRNWQRIFELATLCVAARETMRRCQLHDCAIKWEELGAHCRVIDAPALVLSSTELRARVSCGEALEDAVPPAVAAYIRQQRLYRV